MKFSYSLFKKLFKDLPSKKKVIELLNLYSFEAEDLGGDVLDIALPANRYSDAAGHFGILKELGVILNKKFNLPVKLLVNQPSNQGFLNVKVLSKDACPRYLAYYFEIKSVEESPKEIKNILKSCGINPINNIVDIANLVMLETGQPLHIFDADKLLPHNKLNKTIFVRFAKKNEVIETLDDQKIELDPSILVIADEKNPLAIAGIKGGKNSGVNKSTKRIILEAANFNPEVIYTSLKKINLKTDAAIRFAHGLSRDLVKIGADRAVMYLKQYGAKLIDSFDTNPKKLSEEIIDFDVLKYKYFIGQEISVLKAKKYFELLGFYVENKTKNILRVHIPSWRLDIEDFEDLTEEILRFEGLNNLKPIKPVIELTHHEEDDAFVLKDKIRDSLIKMNFSEVYNHSLIGENDVKIKELNLNFEDKLIEVLYPVSAEFKYLRPSLLIWLRKNLLDNLRFFNEFNIFEIGKIFYKEKNNFIEKLGAGLGIIGKGENPIFELKGVISNLFEDLGISDFLMVDEGLKIKIEIDNKIIGNIYHFVFNNKTFALAELDLSFILKFLEEEVEFKPIPKYPSVIRDISFLVSKDFKIGEIINEIYLADQLIKDVDLIDEYYEEGFGDKQSLTLRLIFQAEDRTLKDIEVDEIIKKLENMLKLKFKVQIR
jgi:phenylalanyl-tRNA synthetase beta chain